MTKKRSKQPLWLTLLHHWTTSSRGTTGLTLPFLIGAQWREFGRPSEDTADISVLIELLADFQRNTPKPYHVQVSECWQLHQPVACLYERSTMSVREQIKLPRGRSALYVSTSYRHNQDVESVAESLWKEVGQAISDGRYSFRRDLRRYVPFTNDDLAFIEEAKSR